MNAKRLLAQMMEVNDTTELRDYLELTQMVLREILVHIIVQEEALDAVEARITKIMKDNELYNL
jgi:hypothetical protein